MMDQPRDDCPCKRLRVSHSTIDTETGMTVTTVSSHPQAITNHEDTDQSQSGEASACCITLPNSNEQTTIKTNPSIHSGFWDFDCEPSCEISDRKHGTGVESRPSSSVQHATQTISNIDVEFGSSVNDSIELHTDTLEDTSTNDADIQYPQANTSSELLKLELFTGPKFNLMRKDVNATERATSKGTQSGVNEAERNKETQKDGLHSTLNLADIEQRSDLRHEQPPSHNTGVCEYVHRVQTVTENMHLKSKQDIHLVSSIKESIKSKTKTSSRELEHSSGNKLERSIECTQNMISDNSEVSSVQTKEPSTFLHDLLEESSKQVKREIPHQFSTLQRNDQLLMQEPDPSSNIPLCNSTESDKVPVSSSKITDDKAVSSSEIVVSSSDNSNIGEAVSSFDNSNGEAVSSSDNSNGEAVSSSEPEVVRPRMIDTGFIEMFTNSVMSSVFSGSNAMGGAMSGSTSSSTSSWNSSSLNQQCGFSGLGNVLDDMSAGLPRRSTSHVSNPSGSTMSSLYPGSTASPTVRSVNSDQNRSSHRDSVTNKSHEARVQSSVSNTDDTLGMSLSYDFNNKQCRVFKDAGGYYEETGLCQVGESEQDSLNDKEREETGTMFDKLRNKPFDLTDEYKQVGTTDSKINSLPSSLLLQIFKHVTIFSLLRRVGLVCKYWYNLCRDPDLWRNVNLSNQNHLEDRDLCTILQYSEHRVRYINLTDCRFLTTHGIRYLLATCTHIELLKIIRCSDVTDWAFDALQMCKNLVSLDLDGNSRLTDNSVTKVSECCPQLRCLHLNHCTKITNTGVISLARNCAHLVELQLNHCCMVSDEAILEVVLGCPNINCLHLMACGVSDTGVKYISKLAQLSNLDLSHIPRLTAGSVIYLSKFCRKLTSINLSLNSTMDDGAIAEIVRNVPDLKRLYSVSCNVSDKALEDIANYCPMLEALDVGWCQGVTDEGVRVVSHSCKHLGYFGLIRCDRVTIETIEELELSHPNIKYSTFILESRRLLERARKEGYRFELT